MPSGGNLQAALNAAHPGDVILLEPGATYIGNFVLPNKGAIEQPITVRSSAADGLLPPAGVRITPADAALLPKIKSPNSVSALRTAPAANHWTLQFLEFQANHKGYGEIIALGAGDSSQTQLAQVPYALVVDRVYIHGDPTFGQKRGLALHSRDTSIVNSYISDCKAVGQDSQAIAGYNGPGNYLIENNYLEAAAENFLLGGADPTIANLVTANVTFVHNYVTKPLAWRGPIIAAPAGVSAAAAAGAGSLPPGEYAYKVIARVAAGQTTKASSPASFEASATIASGVTGGITISWTPVAGADDYVVYGRTNGAEAMYWTTTAPYFIDTGSAGAAGAPPHATRWAVKNLFELKNAEDVTVEGNVFEHLWIADQSGYPIVFTPRNQGGTAPWAIVQRVSFRYNLVRHTAGGVNILGVDDLHSSRLTNHVTIAGNVFDDLTSATWGSGSRPFLIGAGPDAITIDHNTVITTDSSIVGLYGGSATSPIPVTQGAYTNNMSAHNAYGIFGAALSSGLTTINAYLPDGIVNRNVLAAGPASRYPTGNYFPTTTVWRQGFVDYAGGDYHLIASSPYRNAGTDGADLGADIDRLEDETAGAISGDTRTTSETGHVQIATAALPNGTMDQSYAQTLSCTGSFAGCAWRIVAGALPAGVGFDSVAVVISGVPSQAGTASIAVEACDLAAPLNCATATFELTIDPPPLALTIPLAPAASVGVPYQLAPSVSGSVGPVTWSIVSGTLPPGVAIDAQSGAITGVPLAAGTSTAMVQVQDSWAAGRTSTRALTMTVSDGAVPNPMGSREILLRAADAAVIAGSWTRVADPGAAGGYRLWNPDHGAAKVDRALASPANYFELTFKPDAGVAYHLWLRGKADHDSWANDSVIAQFSGAVNASGAPLFRIGTTAGTDVNLEACSGCGLAGWGWQDNGWGVNVLGPAIYFAGAGTQTIRIQVKEDGFSIDQIMLSADEYAAAPPGAPQHDVTILAAEGPSVATSSREVVLHAADASVLAGTWSRVADPSAASGMRVWNPDAAAPKLTAALAAPTNYFEVTFQAEAGVAYHLWMRGKADRNAWANDSIYVQFSHAVDHSGVPKYRIGTTSATVLSIEDGTNAGLAGWGWADDAYTGLAASLYFASSGPQTMRIQVREDGLSLDQIVLSADQYTSAAPGAAKNDATILPR